MIPTRNSERTLTACVASVRREFPGSRIIVVDDSRTLRTVLVASQLGCLVTRGPGRGVGAARMLSLGLVKTPLMVFVDSDAYLDPGFSGILKEFKSDSGMVNGFAIFGKPNDRRMMFFSEQERIFRGYHASMAGCVVDVEAARRVGIPGIPTGEDGAFRRRLREAGYHPYTDTRFTVSHPCTVEECYLDYYKYGRLSKGRGAGYALRSTLKLALDGFRFSAPIVAHYWARSFWWIKGYLSRNGIKHN